MHPKVWRDDTWKPGVLGCSGELNFLSCRCMSSRQSPAPWKRESNEEVDGQVAGFQAAAFLPIGMASGDMTHSWSSAKNGWPCAHQAFLSNKMVSVLRSLVDERCFIL